MTTYTEAAGIGLLTGATDADGDAITVRRIDGVVPAAWPYALPIGPGSQRLVITEAGAVIYDDAGGTDWHPGAGTKETVASFTFTLWDGTDESPAYTATVDLQGVQPNRPPVGRNVTLTFRVAPP